MCIARRLLRSSSEISDVTASMPSLGYFAPQHRVAPTRKAYSLTSSDFPEFGALCPFFLFKPGFRGFLIQTGFPTNSAVLTVGFRQYPLVRNYGRLTPAKLRSRKNHPALAISTEDHSAVHSFNAAESRLSMSFRVFSHSSGYSFAARKTNLSTNFSPIGKAVRSSDSGSTK